MITLIIPIYNGANRIADLINELSSLINERSSKPNKEIEVILVDDGSTDTTSLLLQKTNAVWLRFITLERNHGKGFAIAAGVKEARGDKIIFTDADLPFQLSAIDEASVLLDNGADVALGSRLLRESKQTVNNPWKRFISSRIFSLLANSILIYKVADTQCGFKAFSRSAAQELFSNLTIERFAFDIEILYKAQRAGYNIKTFPVTWVHNDTSTVSLLRDSWSMATDLVRLFLRTRLDMLINYINDDTFIILDIGLGIAISCIPIFLNTAPFITLIPYNKILFITWLLFVPIVLLFCFRLLNICSKHIFSATVAQQISRYIIIGIFNTTLNLGILNCLMLYTGATHGLYFVLLATISYSITIAQAFIWNNGWVFNNTETHNNNTSATKVTFVAVTLFSAAIGIVTLHILVNIIGAPPNIPQHLWATISMIITVPISFICNFLGNKKLVF